MVDYPTDPETLKKIEEYNKGFSRRQKPVNEPKPQKTSYFGSMNDAQHMNCGKIFQRKGYQGVIDKDSHVERVPFDKPQNDRRPTDETPSIRNVR